MSFPLGFPAQTSASHSARGTGKPSGTDAPRGPSTYLRVPTARPRAPAAAGAAAATGPGGGAPGPLWPPSALGVRSPTWAAGPGHISAGHGGCAAFPWVPRARRSGCAQHPGRPGTQGGGARVAPHPRPSAAELDARASEGRVPAISSPQPLLASFLTACESFWGPSQRGHDRR